MATIAFPNPTTASGNCPVYPDGGQAITPSDTNIFDKVVGIQVGGAGAVVVTPGNGNPNVTVTLPLGGIVPFRVVAVLATGTTATNIIAFY